MGVLLIGPKEKKEIEKVKAYAKKNLITQDLMIKFQKTKEAVGNDISRVCFLHDGFRVVFSIEEGKTIGIYYKHISVANTNSTPHPQAVKQIMAEFGMMGDFNKTYMYIEKNIELPTGENVMAINAIQEND